MMKVFFILCHAAAELRGEIREAILAKELRHLGHDARIFRLWDGERVKSDTFEESVPVTYYPSDNPGEEVHRHVSAALADRIRAEGPGLLIVKGIDYALCESLLAKLDPQRTKVGFIIGGRAVHPALRHADFVLTESEQQTNAVAEFVRRPIPIKSLSKYVNWQLADRLYSESRVVGNKRYDILNVGYFEKRKNQIELRRFFGKYRVAMVGDGPFLESVREAAASYPDVSFLGNLVTTDEVLRVISQSRLMVHTSIWEGVPRVIVESLTCGTPVVAFDFAIQSDMWAFPGVHLVSRKMLEPVVRSLLADAERLQELSAQARHFAIAAHSMQRLKETASEVSSICQQQTSKNLHGRTGIGATNTPWPTRRADAGGQAELDETDSTAGPTRSENGYCQTDVWLVSPPGVRRPIKVEGVADEMSAAPLVSCLMVTRGNLQIACYSLQCFLQQTYANRELIVVSDTPNREFWDYLEAFENRGVRAVKTPRASLGELRNVAVAHAKGQLVCQWDDDDLYDPSRLSRSVQVLLATKAAAVFLASWLLWWPSKQLFGLSRYRIWEGTMIAWRHFVPTYPKLARSEDMVVTSKIAASHDIALLNEPRLYCYTITGLNTCDERHFELMFRGARRLYRHEHYQRELQRLAKRTPALAYAATLDNVRPRRGFRSYSLAETARQRAVLRMACPLCGRQGQFPIGRLLNRFDPQIPLSDLLHEIAQCPLRGDELQPCQVHFVDPMDGEIALPS